MLLMRGIQWWYFRVAQGSVAKDITLNVRINTCTLAVNDLERGRSEVKMTWGVGGVPVVEHLSTSCKLSEPLRVLFEPFNILLGTFTIFF